MLDLKLSRWVRTLLCLATLCVLLGEGTEVYLRDLSEGAQHIRLSSALDEVLDDYFLILTGLYTFAVALTGRITVLHTAWWVERLEAIGA